MDKEAAAKRLKELREEIKTQTHTEERLQEDAQRRRPSASQGERPQRKPNLLMPLMDFQLPDL